MNERIRISEIFGPTIQGEGPLIGMAYAYEQATKLRVDPNLNALPNPPKPSSEST